MTYRSYVARCWVEALIPLSRRAWLIVSTPMTWRSMLEACHKARIIIGRPAKVDNWRDMPAEWWMR